MKKMIIIHNIGDCEHKIFFGMQKGHCIKCGKAYKNCEVCHPEEKQKTESKPWELDKVIEEIIVEEFETSEHAVVVNENGANVVSTNYKLLAHAVVQQILDEIMRYANQCLEESTDQQEFMKRFFDGLNRVWEKAERKN